MSDYFLKSITIYSWSIYTNVTESKKSVAFTWDLTWDSLKSCGI